MPCQHLIALLYVFHVCIDSRDSLVDPVEEKLGRLATDAPLGSRLFDKPWSRGREAKGRPDIGNGAHEKPARLVDREINRMRLSQFIRALDSLRHKSVLD